MVSQKRSFEVILFDLGDTLIYFQGDWEEMLVKSGQALYQALVTQQIPLERTAFLTDFSNRMQWYYQEREKTCIEYTSAVMLRDTLENLGNDPVSDSIIESALSEMYRISQEHWQLETDTIEILTWLTAQGYRLGLITNASDVLDAYTLLNKYQLTPYFEKIVISAALGVRKPHPSIFNAALDYFQQPPNRCLMVGDKLANDILGAKKAGIPSAWIKRRARTEFNRGYAHIQPDYEVETLLALKTIV